MTDSSEKNLYANDAQFYDLDPRPVTTVDIPFYLDRVSSLKGDILELACGTGRLTIPLAEVGHDIWGLEFSETMIRQFRQKLSEMPQETAERIHLSHGDMSKLALNRHFPMILLPCRAFQLLLDEELEHSCLKAIHQHLTDDGTFIIDIGNFIGIKGKERSWVSEEEFFDWENTDPKTGYKIKRTHIRKEIDVDRQIIYPHKYYRVTKDDGSVETVVKRSPWKYFFADQIRALLTSNGFKVLEEMGSYDGKPITDDGAEFIFVCKKKS